MNGNTWIGMGLASGLLIALPAYANPSDALETEQPEGASLTFQAMPENAAIAITGIRLNPTETGVEIILETADEQIPNATYQDAAVSVVGNALIVDIPNAVLTGEAFEQAEPIPGVALVSVTSLPGDRVRVAVTGTQAPPTAEVRLEAQGLVVGVVPAATTAETADGDTLRVVVTAEKTPEDAQNVPISLTVLTQAEIEDAQINNIREVAANTPNFFTSVGDRAFNFYSIRGISNSNFLVRDSVGFYLDDVPIEYFHQFFPGELFDVERVEILRGSQNTLYGRNSIAGVVNIISRVPSETLETSFFGEYGEFNQRRIQASISNSLIPGKLGFRLSGVYSARDGFTDNIFLDEDANDQSDLAGRLNLVWTPAENWSFSLNAIQASSDDEGTTYVATDADDPFEIEENEIAELDLSVGTQALRIAYDGSNMRFTSVTAHNASDVGYEADGDYTSQDLFRFDTEVFSDIWSQEFRFQSPATAEGLRWLAGAYIQDRAFNVDRQRAEYTPEGAALFGIPDIAFGDTIAEYDQTTVAAFGQVEVTPIAALTLTAGLRFEYSRDRLERNDLAGTFAGVVTSSGELEDSIDGDALLPRFAVAYRLGSNLTAYGSITRGYRPVTLNYNIADSSLNDVQQEESWNYEIGLKSSWFGDRLIANVAAFINNIDDYQVLLPNNQGFFTDIANAEVRIAGFELELRAVPLDGLELIAGFGYVDAEYTDYTSPFTGQNFDGNELTYAPEYTFNVAVQYRSPQGFFGRLEVQGLGTYFFNDANTLSQDPFALVNARIGYEFDNYGIYLFANNLFDEEYFTAAFAPFGVSRANFGDRRVIGFQVRSSF